MTKFVNDELETSFDECNDFDESQANNLYHN